MHKIKVSSVHSFFWIITIAVMIGLTLPVLIQDGMFMDAVLYASVSHNLAQGLGTFWAPHFGNYALPSFHEHPPLVFGIQSLFFRLLGDSMYVERIYTFLLMCITAMLINQLWKSIYRDDERLRKMGWLPVLLWITIPTCFWSYVNDMQENTMGIFTLLAVLFAYNELRHNRLPYIGMVISGFFIFLASFSKGIPGLFPVVVPLLFRLTHKKISWGKTIRDSAILVGVPLLIYIILMNISVSRDSLNYYLFERVFHRIRENPTVNYRLYTMVALLQDLLIQLSFLMVMIIIAAVKNIRWQPLRKNTFGLLILTGMAASLPLMLTMVQKAFYYVPALPFFALGVATITAPVLLHLVQTINVNSAKFRTAVVCSVLLLAGVIAFSISRIGKVHRDKEVLADIYLINTVVPKFDTIKIPEYLWNDWSLQTYMMRYYNISLALSAKSRYYLVEKGKEPPEAEGYKKANLATLKYDLLIVPEK